MKISILKKNDIKEFSYLAKNIISNTPYYSILAKKHEVKKYNVNNIKYKLKNKKDLYVVIKDKNKIIGFCSGHFDALTFWIDWIGVEKNLRRNKVSIRLFNFLEKRLKKSGVHKIWCDSRTNNKESLPLLKKLKFKKIALLKKHWYKQDFYLWYKFI